jgi:hypothetical protein
VVKRSAKIREGEFISKHKVWVEKLKSNWKTHPNFSGIPSNFVSSP